MSTSFIAEIKDAEDGSGDGILEFPPEFCKEQDWCEGDIIDMVVEGESLILRNLSKEEREGISKQASKPLD